MYYTPATLPHVGPCVNTAEIPVIIISRKFTPPTTKIDLSEALDLLKGEVVLQGGIPSVLACEEGGTGEEFDKYIRDVILPLRGRRGFVLGMSDNVPPNADFDRIRRVASLIA